MLKLKRAPHLGLRLELDVARTWHMGFPFEKMALYQRAQEWAELAEKLGTRTRSSASYGMVDQMLRAANSIPLNVAEGLGRSSFSFRFSSIFIT